MLVKIVCSVLLWCIYGTYQCEQGIQKVIRGGLVGHILPGSLPHEEDQVLYVDGIINARSLMFYKSQTKPHL